QRVVPDAPKELVVSGATVQIVVARAAVQRVVAAAPGQGIVTGATVEHDGDASRIARDEVVIAVVAVDDQFAGEASDQGTVQDDIVGLRAAFDVQPANSRGGRGR